MLNQGQSLRLLVAFHIRIQQILDDSNTGGSFTAANSNSILSP